MAVVVRRFRSSSCSFAILSEIRCLWNFPAAKEAEETTILFSHVLCSERSDVALDFTNFKFYLDKGEQKELPPHVIRLEYKLSSHPNIHRKNKVRDDLLNNFCFFFFVCSFLFAHRALSFSQHHSCQNPIIHFSPNNFFLINYYFISSALDHHVRCATFAAQGR